MKIHRISAREILDSRGNPTVAASVELVDGVIAEASVPSGASTGSHEDVELRDNQKERFFGQGVLRAVGDVNTEIGPSLIGIDSENQFEIDRKMCELDGTPNKARLGANAILAVSLAVARASAVSKTKELFEYLGELYGNEKYVLPTPMFNVINGGKHAKNNIDIQESMIVPIGFKSFEKKLRAGAEIYHYLAQELSATGYEVGVGDEGGFAPNLDDDEMIFPLLSKAIAESGYDLSKVRISLDVAATSFYVDGGYKLKNLDATVSSLDFIKKMVDWNKKYNFLSVEDGLSEEDPNWKQLTESIMPAISIGDDLFTTDPERIELGAKEKLATGVIIKPNQIGTLSETFEAIKKAKEGKLKVVVSHRSGETEDSFIADLAVAVQADFIKSGAPARSERLAKYNRLTQIEDIIIGY